MSDWKPFTPTWVGPKFRWWQFLAKRRYQKKMNSMVISKYKIDGKTLHLSMVGKNYNGPYIKDDPDNKLMTHGKKNKDV